VTRPEDRPRFPVGTKLKSQISGVVSEVVADHWPHPNVVKSAQITDNRYYVVETDGHRSIVFHDILEMHSDVIYRPDDDPPAETISNSPDTEPDDRHPNG
jgi:hypothetical protein